MRIKKFTANNYADALEQVKRELGDDALIMSTRSIKPHSPLSGRNVATKVEITAAVEFEEPVVSNLEEELHLDEDKGLDMKSLIFNLLSEKGQAQTLGLKPSQFEIYSHLVENGLDEQLASKILKRAKGEGDEKPAKEKMRAMDLMKKVIPYEGEINLEKEGPKLVAFVGPTGVGKTTTIAKVAADYAIRKNKKVALVSLDTYRLGAVDQLQIYGDIMQLPVEVAGGGDELREIVKRHSDKDLILIDTTGRSHRDKDYSCQLKEIFAAVGGVETHLVLSVTAHEKQFSTIYQQFCPLGVDRVLFTKLDEGLSFGPLFNFSVRNRVPLSYFTVGQNVPEDLEVAVPDKVISLIFN
ncbi:MAG: flagellar biosynthesis protein FlhF [Nitrospinae bacterium]|nr:flagellar biosynthesis protein FlhF [Nitrospinota bacterium]